MKTIGIIPNFKKKKVFKVATENINWLEENGAEVRLLQSHAAILEREDLGRSKQDFLSEVECVITLGGDGTLLNASRMVDVLEIPLLGVNMGHLGFLTELVPADLPYALGSLLTGDYIIDERSNLEARVERGGKEVKSFLALNDVVVTKGAFARIIYLQTYIDDEFVATYPADGMVIASPTGSTAYSLSAGGPIISPTLSALVVTPICSHALYTRTIVVSKYEEVRIKVKSDHMDIMLTLDGQQAFGLQPDDEVFVRRADTVTKLIRLKGRSFYEVLRTRLKEGLRVYKQIDVDEVDRDLSDEDEE
jgi:NAD+ kinase